MNSQKYLGNYEIEEALGSDPFFECFRAVDAIRKRTVIIKLLKADVLSNRKVAKQFFEQAKLASELVHPNLAWIWEASEIEGQYFLVERFVEGKSLRQILGKSEKLPHEKAHSILSQISRGLDFAHSRGFAHGNIKPENIVINPDLGAILTDIGPSIALQTITPRWSTVIELEMAPYTAPEIWQGNPPSAKSDQYSLACIFAEMLSGEKTFGAPGINTIREKHLSAFQSPLSWAGAIPWPTAKAILRALEQEPSSRFDSLETFATAPQNIKKEININPKLKEEADNQTQAWHEAQQKARQEAEEATRLAALEKAKREIKEELKRQEPILQAQYPDSTEASLDTPSKELTNRKERTRTARASKTWRNWFWIGLVSILIILVAIWTASNRLSVNSIQPTVTPTITALSPSHTSTLTITPSPEVTATLSPTVTKSSTRTHSATLTRTPTMANTNTITPTTSLTITTTRTPKDEDTSISGSP